MTSTDDLHDSIVVRLSKETLQDIEGLDPAKFGFGREECCGPLPSKLPGSMLFTQHIFLATDLSASKWGPRTENVPGHSSLEKSLKEVGGMKLTVYHRPGPDACVLRFQCDEALESIIITQYSCISEGALPWESKGAISCDRSNEVFVFVCAHRTRDSRCGYCGAVLVDLLRQSMKTKEGSNEFVHVYPCSHIGGHIYAGNVLVYTKHGGVCFGCFTPADIDTLVDFLIAGGARIPPSLESRVRGRIGYSKANSKCCVM
ncbi:sucraseferredoxin-like family protein [Trypanosoma grayi]|uniref:sucraseferredoxin-like family protein n=1 Tax=Trypanosoma grayi TaxID=71804 RepID=UPI0004F45DF4|nr:sucraseferredoxin-like family protein [Trypanosoma grayi]KEG13056.1 sucraseferredoxin-like family protein [Trypanosoma grayi]